MLQWKLNDLKQRPWHQLSIYENLSFEEPVTAVLAISVAQLEQFNIGRVPFEHVHEQVMVVLDVCGIHAKPKNIIDLFESGFSTANEINNFDRFWHDTSVEGLDPVRVMLLCHPVK